MDILDIQSPIGALRLHGDGTAIIKLEWVARISKTSDDKILNAAARELINYFTGKSNSFTVPLRPEGSAFQQSVWHMMQKIPAGKTMSYGQVAAKLKSGARAVGTACGKNPIPIIIPCHRIVGTGGAMGGYSGRGGEKTKQFLLDLENQRPAF